MIKPRFSPNKTRSALLLISNDSMMWCREIPRSFHFCLRIAARSLHRSSFSEQLHHIALSSGQVRCKLPGPGLCGDPVSNFQVRTK